MIDKQCTACKKFLPDATSLDQHLFKEHGLFSGKQKCDVCEKEVSCLSQLAEHAWSEHGLML